MAGHDQVAMPRLHDNRNLPEHRQLIEGLFGKFNISGDLFSIFKEFGKEKNDINSLFF